jgi:outer membrane protein OmpA-like peptidoglycan-associated protein
MRSFTIALLALLLACVGGRGSHAETGDIPGAKDYPGIGRFAGSVITGYEVKDFDATRLQAAAFADGKPTDELRPEGRITRVAYKTGPGPSMLEVSRNFETQLQKAGFETLLSCTTDQCGGIPFTEALDTLNIPQMWVDGFDYRYYAGVKKTDAGETYATVLVSKNNDEIYAQLVVAVVGAIENKMIDAAAMAKGLGESGHIALYGIYFDTDKAVIKPESAPTLAEIAKLLNGQPALNVFIVGHTDTQGAYDYNMDLSKRRAEAVAAALAKTYKIAPKRMRAAGVGFLAPVSSNASDEGRALNRRVELVAP